MRIFYFICLLCGWSFSTFSQNDNIGSGRAILFDGIDDYIDLGDIYDDVALPITISAWVYIDPNPNVIQYPIFTSQDNLLTYNGFTFVTSTLPHIGFTIGDGRGGNSSVYRRSRAGYYDAMGQWVYLTAVARSGYDIHTYVNGQELSGEYQGSSNYPMNSLSPDEVAKIGYLFSNNFTYWFKGMMDELRIWNRALSPDEIRESMCRRLQPDEPNLIGYWNFDETGGDVLKDLSQNGYDGTLKGNPQRVFSGAPVGDESVFLYTTNWTGKTLSKDDLTVANVSSAAYGIHIYKVNSVPSQAGGLDVARIQPPYYGVFIADDGQTNTFDLSFSGYNACAFRERIDNSQPSWDPSESFSDIPHRIEMIQSYEGTPFTVALGDDPVVCDQNSFLLETGIDPSGKTFRWSTGANSTDLEVSSSGKYSVEVNDGCLSAKDTVVVTFMNSPPEFSMGADESLCEMTTRTLSAGLEYHDYTFTWQDGSSSEFFEASEFGTYWLRVENECGLSVDSIAFSQTADPELVVHLGNDVTFCQDLPFFLLAHPEPEGKTFQWNTGQNTQAISIHQSGIYAVEVKGACKSARDTIHVTYAKPPATFSLGEDELLCALDSIPTLRFTGEKNGLEFTWQDGSKGDAMAVKHFGTYWLKVENACGSAADSITFTQKTLDDVKTYNFISPDTQDLFNQYFELDARLLGSSLVVFNRWGKPVFESVSYQNDWDGEGLPSGVYYYTVRGACVSPIKGTLTILR